MLTNPFTGQTITRISQTNELLVMESSYIAGARPAPPHFHPAQEEHFVVLSGAVQAKVGGEEMVLGDGDELVVPAGTLHEFGGHADDHGTVRWEVAPPLRTWEFFEGLFGALNAAADPEGADPKATEFDVADYADVFRLE